MGEGKGVMTVLMTFSNGRVMTVDVRNNEKTKKIIMGDEWTSLGYLWEKGKG